MKKKYNKPKANIIQIEINDICVGSCYSIEINTQQLQQKEHRTIKITNDEIWNHNF